MTHTRKAQHNPSAHAHDRRPSQGEILYPLLETLHDLGGSARGSDVADALAQRFDLPNSVITESAGTARGNLWRRHVRFARQKAVALGYIAPSTGDRTWNLTDEGAAGIQHAAPGIIVEFVVDPSGRAIGARIDIAMTLPTTHLLVRGDARKLGWIDDGAIPLIVTSCPYYDIVQYEHDDAQLAEIESYETFLDALQSVWRECYRILMPGGRLCVNVGDVLRARRAHGEHHVLPLHASILTQSTSIGFRALTGILWQKFTTINAEGGGRGVLGKPGQPNGVIAAELEHILLLRKPGPYRQPTAAQIRDSHISREDYARWFRPVWDDIPGARADRGHPAPFPIEIPRRLASMFSFKGDTVADVFGGSGSTALGAAKAGRDSIYIDCSERYVRDAIARVSSGHRELLTA